VLVSALSCWSKMALPAVSEFQDIVDTCCGTSFTS
jgi:hypothetical protein